MARTARNTAEPTAKPATGAKGTAWLTEVVNKNLGTSYTGYQIRILIRKLVKAGTIDRGEGRYEFAGLKDPRVVAVVKAAKAGGVKEATTEKVEAAKASSTRRRKPSANEETEETAKPAARRSRAKAKPEPEPEELADDEDDDDLDLDEL